jgi:hypothetical protein
VSSAARGPAEFVFAILREFLEEDSRIDQLESIGAESSSGIMACLNADEEEMCVPSLLCASHFELWPVVVLFVWVSWCGCPDLNYHRRSVFRRRVTWRGHQDLRDGFPRVSWRSTS